MVPAGKYGRDTGYCPAFKKRMRIMSKDREDEQNAWKSNRN